MDELMFEHSLSTVGIGIKRSESVLGSLLKLRIKN